MHWGAALNQIESAILDVAKQSGKKFDAKALGDLAGFLNTQIDDWADKNALTDKVETNGMSMQGGHVNLSFTTTALDAFTKAAGDPSISSLVAQVFGNQIFGNRQDVGAVTLHSTEKKGTFDFHLDLYNPKDDLVGLGKHFVFEVLKGHTGACLDPAFN
jgi:hypothetical protein